MTYEEQLEEIKMDRYGMGHDELVNEVAHLVMRLHSPMNKWWVQSLYGLLAFWVGFFFGVIKP